MNLLKYYKDTFQADLTLVSGSGHGIGKRVITIPDLFPTEMSRIKHITEPEMFLLCFFFEVLLDQSIHFKYREFHGYYDEICSPTKFQGILAAVGHNQSPIDLIVLSVIHCKNEHDVYSQLPDFCDYIISEYIERIQHLAKIAQLNDSKAIYNVFLNMYEEVAGVSIGTSICFGDKTDFGDYYSHKYSIDEFNKYIIIIKDKLNEAVNTGLAIH